MSTWREDPEVKRFSYFQGSAIYRAAMEAAVAAERRRITSQADRIRGLISDAYYDARNDGGTMETAADRAIDAVLAVIEEDE